jgi:hypothetical protein
VEEFIPTIVCKSGNRDFSLLKLLLTIDAYFFITGLMSLDPRELLFGQEEFIPTIATNLGTEALASSN